MHDSTFCFCWKNFIGEWIPTLTLEDDSCNPPPQNNNVLGHILKRLNDIVYPPTVSERKDLKCSSKNGTFILISCCERFVRISLFPYSYNVSFVCVTE